MVNLGPQLQKCLMLAAAYLCALSFPVAVQADSSINQPPTQTTSRNPLPWNGPKMSDAELRQRGKALYAALQDRFNEIDSAHNLPRPGGFEKRDVSDVLAKYIPVGMPFFDAETILKAANATLADTPPRQPVPGDAGYDRYDILGGISLNLVARVTIIVRPNEPAKSDATVQGVEAGLGTDSL
jgi:hypothetical protein